MKLLSTELVDWAELVRKEILLDETVNDYFWPKSGEHTIFEQAYMKFINRNLNYFAFESMIVQTTEPQEFNPALHETLRFCRHARFLGGTSSNTPFGRMCVWKLPAGSRLLAHRDNYAYHRFITRNIFVVGTTDASKIRIRIEGQEAPVTPGTLFQFQPAEELHEFINESSEPLYFLGFDCWHLDKLKALLELVNIKKVQAEPLRQLPFNGVKGKAKYISQH